MVELVYTSVLETDAERIEGSSPSGATKLRISFAIWLGFESLPGHLRPVYGGQVVRELGD